jgi:nucleotide-binding universal stress UspA family protein
MKILFATDGSAHALAALKALIDHLDSFRDPVDLTVINVHPALPYRRAAGWAGKDAIAKYYEEESDAALKPSVDELTRRGIPHTANKRVGEPAPTIVKAAREGAFDMIAMGTQGHTALATLMLGSVSAKVLAEAPVPVLLLR